MRRICISCGGLAVQDRRPGLLRCGSCGLVFADLEASADELAALYGADYFHGEEYSDYQAERDSLELNFGKRLHSLLRHLSSPRRFLFEIGCAYGYFLNLARGSFDEVAGVDVSAAAVDAARMLGLNAVAGDYLLMDLPCKADVIAMFDVIEHLARPDLFIEKAAIDVRPGGLLAITTGDIESLNAQIRGRRWRMIHPPTHLFYFSRRSITALLERRGFDIVEISYPGISRRVRSILYGVLALRLHQERLYQAVKDFPFTNRSLTINLLDIMFVLARKR
jgi:SAM-dependent methyltransferase